jgi:hypothetical protein
MASSCGTLRSPASIQTASASPSLDQLQTGRLYVRAALGAHRDDSVDTRISRMLPTCAVAAHDPVEFRVGVTAEHPIGGPEREERRGPSYRPRPKLSDGVPMLKTNEEKTVQFAMQVQPGQPVGGRGWRVDRDGKPFILPGIGGISLNVAVGDPATGWAADHLEPGVSCCTDFNKRNDHPNNALQRFACVGNQAKVISGDAKGATGVVLGHHGGSEHVIVEFDADVKERLTYDDKIMIRAHGQGLALLDHPHIKLYNLDPSLLARMNIEVAEDGVLRVPVTTRIPAACMGSGVGSTDIASGDYDVMTSDPESVAKYGLDKMRFGDIVALLDHDNSYGRTFRRGAISIGIVVHSDCLLPGHGPGITTLMTCATAGIEPVIDPKACLADILGVGTTLD